MCLQYNYSTVLQKNFLFYDAQRVGQLPNNFRIPWRGSSLTYEIGPRGLGFGNVTGGWMGGGNAGTVKNTIPTAMSISMLAWGLLEFPLVRSLPHISTCKPPAASSAACKPQYVRFMT